MVYYTLKSCQNLRVAVISIIDVMLGGVTYDMVRLISKYPICLSIVIDNAEILVFFWVFRHLEHFTNTIPKRSSATFIQNCCEFLHLHYKFYFEFFVANISQRKYLFIIPCYNFHEIFLYRVSDRW